MEENRRELTKDEEIITKDVGYRIAKARKSKGITQIELAKRLNVSQSMICIYEQGRRRIPITQFIKIAQAIGLSPGKILDGQYSSTRKKNGRSSRRFSKRLDEIENLPEYERKALVKTIDAVLFQYKMKQIEVQAQK